MPKTLSYDLRIRVLAAVSDAIDNRTVAERFGVSAASVSRWRTLARERGAPVAKPRGGDWRSSLGSDETVGSTKIAKVSPDDP